MSPQSHKRIEIITEAPHARAVTAFLEASGATGWTMLPVMSGKGRNGLRGSGDPSGVGDTVLIIAIANETVANAVLSDASRILASRIAILSVSDAVVLRKGHF